MIDHETFCKIHDCHDRHGLTIQQTARALGLHPRTVATWLARSCFEPRRGGPRRSVLDPFKPRITRLLDTHPYSAQQIFQHLREEGYGGGMTILRDYLRRTRPTKRPVYLKPHSAPSECALVNWAQFGHIAIGRACRPLTAFVMVLSYSRQVFLRFFLNARLESFLRGHLAAFEAWNGCPRVILYDNLRSAVLERHGDAIRFHPTLLEFATHYHYEPRPVAVARGNEKGRVERAIRYVRDNFFAARAFADVDELNAQAAVWCSGMAADRPCPEHQTLSVREAFAAEAPYLRPLPDNAYPLIERVAVDVGKTPYVRFDLNDYSVPHINVRRSLTVLAEPHQVRIVDGAEILACHHRSYGKGEQIDDDAHVEALVAEKRAARHHRGTDRLARAVPASQNLLRRAAERGDNLGAITATLLRLLDRYGAAELEASIGEALERGVPHPNAVRLALERRREQRRQPPPITVDMPAHIKTRDTPVRPHRLEAYDQLKDQTDE